MGLYISNGTDIKKVEEDLRGLLTRGCYNIPVMVASEDFTISCVESINILLSYLRDCVEKRFIPWVYSPVGGLANA